MGVRTVIRTTYHVGRLGLFLYSLIPYFEWKTRRAKSAFKNELLKNGIPSELAASLADSYGNGNKNLVISVLRRSSNQPGRNS